LTVLFPLFNGLDGLAEELCVEAGLLSPKVCKIHFSGHLPVSPTYEALQTGIWQAGNWLITVSGIALEQLQAGDLLVQERNASQRSERKRKSTPD